MKKISFVLTLLLLCTFVSYSQAGEVRTWTAGNHSVEGEFVELLENGMIVRIRKTNGKFTRVPLAKLSEEDQEYIKEKEGNPFEDENTETTLPASSRKAGERKVLTVGGIEYAFRWCPPGEFMMGSENGHDNEKPVHKVKLTRGFWLLETEVTQEMWQSVMGKNPSTSKGEQEPVEDVSWDDCQEFCKKLSQKLGQQFKLPTEAQWEYACRAGTTGDYAGDIDSMVFNPIRAMAGHESSSGYENNSDSMVWHENNSGYDNNSDSLSGNDDTLEIQENGYVPPRSLIYPVGRYKPNAWGLYDMHGNVREWCSDYYEATYYDRSPASDPENTTSSTDRVVRGGGCYDDAEGCRSAVRRGEVPGVSKSGLGLRVSLVPSQD